ncbi:MAG: hypothetical protein P8P52_10140 [Opitutae bacterium]|nr:hypothetical protein [Opitutae bacterium]
MILRVIIIFLLCTGLNAAVTITFDEIGNDVVSYYSGTLNTNDPAIIDTSELSSFASKFNPSLGYYANTPGGWRTASGSYVVDAPTSSSPFYNGPRLGNGHGFGSGNELEPTQISGDAFGVFQNSLVLADDWTSGSAITGQMTWANTSLESLGVDGSQVHTWTLRGTGDTITMTVVPEFSSYAFLLGGLALGFVALRRR